MKEWSILLDGKPVHLVPTSVVRNGSLWVPLEAFCHMLEAHLAYPEGEGRVIVCRGDHCVPLTIGKDAVVIDDITFAPLVVLTGPLGLGCQLTGDVIRLTTKGHSTESTGPAMRARYKPAPDFTLPDVRTGHPVALRDCRGKKTVIFAWASW